MIRDLPLEPSEVWPHTLQVHKHKNPPLGHQDPTAELWAVRERSVGAALSGQLSSSNHSNSNCSLLKTRTTTRAWGMCQRLMCLLLCRAAQHSAHNRLLQRVWFTGNKHAHACVCRPPHEFFNLPIILPCITSQHSFPSLHTHNFF